MHDSAKVSVIIPTHNGVDNIKRAIFSVITQDYENLEIIVVDDNGRGTELQEKTKKSIEIFLAIPYFKYVVHEVNKNGSAARNTGAKYSTGKYLNFLDDDDEFGPCKLRYQVALLESSSEEYAGCYSSTVIKSEGKYIRTIWATKSGDLLIDQLTSSVRIGTPSLLIRKSVWENIGGYDESFYRHQDWEFNARVLDKYKVIASKNAYYIRNYTFRHSTVDVGIKEKNLINYNNKILLKIKSIPEKKLKIIIKKKFITILIGYLKTGHLREFFRVWNEQNFRLYDIFYILKYVFNYFKSRSIYGKSF